MPTEIYPADDAFAPGFAFDADLQFGSTFAYQASQRKVEGRGTISEHIASQPKKYTITGIVTAMTVPPATPEAEKLTNAKKRLEEMADKRQIVLVLSDSFSGYLAIERAEVIESVDLGKAIRATVNFTEIVTTTVGTAVIPKSRLRKKVKKKAAPAKKGGAAKGSQPTGKSRTGLAYLSDKAKKLLGL